MSFDTDACGELVGIWREPGRRSTSHPVEVKSQDLLSRRVRVVVSEPPGGPEQAQPVELFPVLLYGNLRTVRRRVLLALSKRAVEVFAWHVRRDAHECMTAESVRGNRAAALHSPGPSRRSEERRV